MVWDTIIILMWKQISIYGKIYLNRIHFLPDTKWYKQNCLDSENVYRGHRVKSESQDDGGK